MKSWSQSSRHQHHYDRNNLAAEASYQYYCPSELARYIDWLFDPLFYVSVTLLSQLLLQKSQIHTL